ncbi:CBO0543 family protein [Mangrovibacillus cuniculi]|uniref:Uncharacterized protein n=1 Tax=Mangrovibacillus cuniculi TaxID=2593652 RepID=A0A7S8CB87_9BACI|nr:CBO0543 family protein [Mangrovibacillus cuniculi]QPC46773.1 hypothetical protein G8O30_07250 [Mangrovibacillus cuniculi]
MDKILLKGLILACCAAAPFLFKRRNMYELFVVFFSKGVVSTLLDAYVVNSKRIAYPVRPFPDVFKTNIVFDMLFFPLCSVLWIRQCYKDSVTGVLWKSLTWSIPMSGAQWVLQRYTNLLEWRRWNVLYTFVSVTFTLIIIRILIEVLRRLQPSTFSRKTFL